ncbi:non-hydrolyzing UDP-N-acetylglucosamine 2-epimerase [Bacteroides sp. 519]|uniref:non-hydrolyzing UDP-N-acetylglucosamine 2-epimerase n=1 Tax=Bacteroides sp. 519 TaxID=2302937 RepID=UPI0013D1A5DA|nr:UDP-N-acetylglucosamine 2-epimerase (non-hydrolyzing) [Bacteroides sp. 519]NDV59535.1 UDP-N-acetylglucosamine 2-epimerase (non-hydrolyzing) [Bacteroides sp. 519]
MKITIIAGARPNFMKIAPIIRAINAAAKVGKNITYRLIYTGLKNDTDLDPSLFIDLDIAAPDAYLEIQSKNSIELAALILMAFDKELTNNPADVVLVVDDLTPTMSCAIVAKKHGAKVAHLVAGTRSFDMDMPKEVNRMITDGLADYLFTAGMIANRTLSQTGTDNKNIYYVGNILIDSIRYSRSKLIKPVWLSTLLPEKQEYILLTLNRRALLDNKKNLQNLISVICKSNLPIIAPLHPYVQDTLKKLQIDTTNLHILPPQGYLSFGYLLNNAKAIITDSGNVAEEATFLGIPCITLNNYAEHPETYRMGTNELVGEDPEALDRAMQLLLNKQWKTGEMPERWDGRTAERIIQILLDSEK